MLIMEKSLQAVYVSSEDTVNSSVIPVLTRERFLTENCFYYQTY